VLDVDVSVARMFSKRDKTIKSQNQRNIKLQTYYSIADKGKFSARK
jgi:hypothetical protein